MTEPPAGGSGTPSVGAALTRKLGPFPGIVWIGLVVAGVLVWRALQARNGGTVTVLDPASGTEYPAGESPSGVGAGAGGGSSEPPAKETNAHWAQRVTAGGVPGYTRAEISNALVIFLADGELPTQRAGNLVNKILGQYGPPPNGVHPVKVKAKTPAPKPPAPKPPAPKPPAPKPPAPKPPAPARSYTVQRGDTLSSIAQRMYGNSAAWPKIAAANPQITNPNLIHPGDVLRIPA